MMNLLSFKSKEDLEKAKKVLQENRVQAEDISPYVKGASNEIEFLVKHGRKVEEITKLTIVNPKPMSISNEAIPNNSLVKILNTETIGRVQDNDGHIKEEDLRDLNYFVVPIGKEFYEYERVLWSDIVKINSLGTLDITKIINGLKNPKDIKLKIKNKTTKEVHEIANTYVADGILFLFTSKSDEFSYQEFMARIDDESQNQCWKTFLEEEYGYTEECGLDVLAKDLVMKFPLKVYLGSHGDCPMAHYRNSNLVKDIIDIDFDRVNHTVYLIVK